VTGDVTVSVTGTVALAIVEPRGVSVIVAEYVPAVIPLPFAVTVSVAGVVPEVGLTVSQAVELETVKKVATPPELTLSVCAAGGAAP
jgi:hypothetical protein